MNNKDTLNSIPQASAYFVCLDIQRYRTGKTINVSALAVFYSKLHTQSPEKVLPFTNENTSIV